MSRPLAGLACRIRVPVRQYQAVALVVRQRTNVVRLMHRDLGLSLDVEEFENFATAEDYCDRLANFLDLPSVTAAGTPAVEASIHASGPEARRTGVAKARRPRFLTRRHAGGPVSVRRITGREIIARH
jgi:hypothetical protein